MNKNSINDWHTIQDGALITGHITHIANELYIETNIFSNRGSCADIFTTHLNLEV